METDKSYASDTVYANWKCLECGQIVKWTYDDLTNVGLPICQKCDIEMELVSDCYIEKE